MEKEALRAVLVGCGSISSAWLKAIADEHSVALVGLMDINPEKMAETAHRHGLRNLPRSTDLDRILDDTAPDAVFNCTLPEAHREVTLTALRHGCHVLGEKPLADSMDSARDMVAAADHAGKLFAVIQNRRYQTQIRALRKFLESGAIGTIHTLNADFYLGAHFGGFRDHMKHVLLLDMAIHSFDQARFIAQADPRRVYCHEWNPVGSWYDHHASAQCIFEMTGDVVFNYRGSWCCEGLNTTWECDWRVIGDKGCVTWDGGDRFRAQSVQSTGDFFSEMTDRTIDVEMPKKMHGGHKGCIMEFIHCVRHGGTPETTAADNIKSLAMVFGAIDSAETGGNVPIRI